jgi:hypothetical protein
MKRLLFTAAIVGSMIVPAMAAMTVPTLPATAKKLTGTEILTLYDGNTVKWTNFAKGMTGTGTSDFKKKTQTGTWAAGDKKGNFTSTISVKGDKFCYKTGKSKEVCDSVYTDGADTYNVNAKGIVDSEDQKQ